MCFSSEQIKAVVNKNLNLNEITGISRIGGGYSKYSYELIIDGKPFIFQIMKTPDDIPQLMTDNKLQYLYPGGVANYLKSKAVLEELNILVPQTIFYDSSGHHFEYDCALYEFVESDSYTGFTEHQKNNSLPECLFNFGTSLGLLKNHTRHFPGDLCTTEGKFIPHDLVFEVTGGYLDVSSSIPFISGNRDALKTRLKELHEAIISRDTFHLIHSDFKPDNFRFDTHGNIYWIDFESLQYFDMEFEFSQFITPEFILTNNEHFRKGYFRDNKIGLDENRLLFYRMYRSISQICYCSNPDRIRNDREPSAEIIASNIQFLKAQL